MVITANYTNTIISFIRIVSLVQFNNTLTLAATYHYKYLASANKSMVINCVIDFLDLKPELYIFNYCYKIVSWH